jgi:subtilase family serine protease
VVGNVGWSTDLQPEPPVFKPAPVASPAPAPKNSPDPAAKPSSSQADLTVSAIKVRGQVPDGKDDCKDGKNPVAVVVKNAGGANAGSFAVRLTVDGDEAGEESVEGLEAGKEREVRFGDVKLTKGEHKLVATVDPKKGVDEASDDNNDHTMTAACRDDN